MNDMITVTEAKELLNVSDQTVKRLIKSGVLKAKKTSANGHYRIFRQSLEEYLIKQENFVVVAQVH